MLGVKKSEAGGKYARCGYTVRRGELVEVAFAQGCCTLTLARLGNEVTPGARSE